MDGYVDGFGNKSRNLCFVVHSTQYTTHPSEPRGYAHQSFPYRTYIIKINMRFTWLLNSNYPHYMDNLTIISNANKEKGWIILTGTRHIFYAWMIKGLRFLSRRVLCLLENNKRFQGFEKICIIWKQCQLLIQ